MNWIQHNLTQRLIDKSVDFKLELTPSKFKIMDFHDAANYTARRIADLNIPLYLALSGGVDSEYILLCFHRNKDRKSTRLNSSHIPLSRMPSSA